MKIAMIVIPFICLAAFLYAYLYLWHAINSIKDSLENIRYNCDNAYEIVTAKYMLQDCIINSHKELLTEIACLATKNNEDIKRAKEGFQQGDVIEYGGEEALVLEKQTLTLNNVEDVTDYTIWSITQGVQHITASHLEHNAKFLRRASL